MVAQPPPGRRAGFQDHQILRAEQNRGQHTGHIPGGFLLRAVAPDLPGPGAGKQHKPKDLLPLLRKDLAGHFSKICAEAHHFRRFLGPEASSASKIGNSFQKIGLSLGVVAYDQVHAGFKIKLHFPIIPEIAKLQIL